MDIGAVADDVARFQGGFQHRRKTVFAGERGAFGADDGEHGEVPAVTGKARQEAGAEERGFAGTRGAEDGGKARCGGGPEAAQRVEGEDDGTVATEEDAGVVGLKREKAAIGGAVGVAVGRPKEVRRIEPGLLETGGEAGESGAGEVDERFWLETGRRDGDGPACIGRREIDELPLGCELDRQILVGGRLYDDAEDLLVHLLGEQEFSEAPFGFRPVRADQDKDQLALLGRSLERGLPAVAGDEATARVEIEEYIAPAALGEPIMDRQRFGVVGRRMRNEDLAQRPARRPKFAATIVRKARREKGLWAAFLGRVRLKAAAASPQNSRRWPKRQ